MPDVGLATAAKLLDVTLPASRREIRRAYVERIRALEELAASGQEATMLQRRTVLTAAYQLLISADTPVGFLPTMAERRSVRADD